MGGSGVLLGSSRHLFLAFRDGRLGLLRLRLDAGPHQLEHLVASPFDHDAPDFCKIDPGLGSLSPPVIRPGLAKARVACHGVASGQRELVPISGGGGAAGPG